MELKIYQRHVIDDLTRYLALLSETRNISEAFSRFWMEKSVRTGFGQIKKYQNVLPGVPSLCMKVPTGGGKTFLACNAVKPIFDALPATKTKVAVWLVPSDAILTQTIKALKNPDHPYRQKLDVDFGSRVEMTASFCVTSATVPWASVLPKSSTVQSSQSLETTSM